MLIKSAKPWQAAGVFVFVKGFHHFIVADKISSCKQKTPGFASGGNHNHISLVRNLKFS
ncbi:hypothetical protein MgSA37_02317 [Mucilaginibacter gotjawali]|uniref:Uncharacterized protein n=2 Tax=Mucilaginibacter gotjawali TaxID=1550579 RepID=A0A110AZH5_9SPHI|nr:hypothetical protein [Mucilaginibacter gotjawali]BAU54145.1 hypothetical protein MgSA37_02317 [Mucilaginibacter gotjawali]